MLPSNVDVVLARSDSPLRAEFCLAAAIFREPTSVSNVLRGCGSVEPSAQEHFLDVLASAGKCYHLLAGVAFQFPAAIGSGYLDRVTEPLCFAS